MEGYAYGPVSNGFYHDLLAAMDLFAANALLRFCNKADRAVRARTPAN